MKKITLVLATFFALCYANAQTTLAAGDIAFLGSNTDVGSTTTDNVSFVLLKDIDAATTIIFTDRGWNDTGSFSNFPGDGELTWTSGSARSAGEIVVLDLTNGALSNNAAYGSIGDQLFALQGSIASPVFIAGLHFNVATTGTDDANWDGSATTNSTSALPNALSTGNTAVRLTDGAGLETDNFQFSCITAGGSPVTGTAAAIRAILHNVTNWSSDTTTGYNPPVEAGCVITLAVASDTVPPVITCAATPADITTGITGMAAIPDLVSGSSATDDVSAVGNITITQSPTAGTMVSVGVNMVTVTAMDEAGNTASCMIDVTALEPLSTSLTAGDIAFVGFNLDGTDSFAFIILEDIIAGTNIKFTDCGVANPNTITCSSGDSNFTWYAPSAITAGTIITLPGSSFSGPLASQGDQILAYQGTSIAPTFLAGIHANVEPGVTNDADWDGGITMLDESALPDQLTNGVNALRVHATEVEIDNWQLDCSSLPIGSLTGTKQQIAALINDLQYWVSDNAMEFSPTVNAACMFAVTEPILPTITSLDLNAMEFCAGDGVVLTINGDLGSADEWVLYSVSCGGTEVTRTSGSSFTFTASNNITLYVRGEGASITTPQPCASVDIVIDATPPTAVCQDITVQLDATGTISIAAADVDGGSTDNCSPVSLSISQTSFTTANIGANTVTLTVMDDNGNEVTCAATVTVEAAPDITAPTLVSTDPLDDATGVAVDALLTATFDEPVQWAGGNNISIQDVTDGVSFAFFGQGNPAVTFSGNSLEIDPPTEFTPGHEYAVFFNGGALEDLSGNGFPQSSGTNWTFTTDPGDIDPPMLVSTDPLDDATGVAVDALLTATFDEPVQWAGGNNISIQDVTDGVSFAFFGQGNPAVTFSGNSLEIDPPTEFTPGHEYAVFFNGGALEDLSGNGFPQSSGTNWTFTTDPGDIDPPMLVSTDPLDDATGVAVDALLTATFDEPVQWAGGNNISIIDLTDGVDFAFFGQGNPAVTFSGNILMINPVTDFTPGHEYGVSFNGGALEDLSGNSFPQSLPSNWSFTIDPIVLEDPIANAGPDREIELPTNELTLDGSGSDPDGGVVTFQWFVESGPNAPTGMNINTEDVTISNLIEGTYVFRLEVTDDENVTVSDRVTVKVLEQVIIPCSISIINQPQDVDVTVCEIEPLGIFRIEASGSGALSYLWEEKTSSSLIWSALTANENTLEIATEALADKNGSTFRVTVTSDNGTPGDDTDDCSVTSDEVTLKTVSLEPLADLPVNIGLQSNLGGGLPAQGTQTDDLGVYSGPGVIDDGNGLTFSWDPEVAGEGIQTITYSYTNENGCTSSATDEILVLPALPLLAISDVTQTEGTGGTTSFAFEVSLSEASTETIIVRYSTIDEFAISPDDYDGADSETLTFSPGETSKFITINVVADSEIEEDETFFVLLSGGGGAGVFWFLDGLGKGTILNDDQEGCTASSNVALNKPSSQSSTYGNGIASFANDGNLSGTSPWDADLQHTNDDATGPWWEVDLGSDHDLEEVVIHNRTNGFQDRLSDFYVFVSDAPFSSSATASDLVGDASVWNYYFEGPGGALETIPSDVNGRYVRIQLTGQGFLHMAELEAIGCPIGPDVCEGAEPVVITAAGPFLDSGSPEQLVASPSGGIWSGQISATGLFDPSIGAGDYIINYSYTNGDGCTQSDTVTIMVDRDNDVPEPCDGTENVALNKPAIQSSTYGNGEAFYANDGNLEGGSPWSADLQHTVSGEAQPWWEVDLGSTHELTAIKLYNRTNRLQSRLNNFYIFVSDSPFSGSLLDQLGDPNIESIFFEGEAGLVESFATMATGRYVRVQLQGAGTLHMAELEVYGCPTDPSVCDGSLPVTIAPTGPFLDTDGEQQLTASPEGGTWSGAVNASGVINPSALGAGTYTVGYMFTNENGCTKSDTITVEVTEDVAVGPCTESYNLALDGTASHSSTYGNGEAFYANDGNQSGSSPWTADLQHTLDEDSEPWWEVDLGEMATLDRVVIYNRTDKLQSRLNNFYVLYSDAPFGARSLADLLAETGIEREFFSGAAGLQETFTISTTARYVRIQKTGSGPLHMAEVEVYGCPFAAPPLQANLNTFNVWPNPASAEAKASFEKPTNVLSLMIYDMQGRIVKVYEPSELNAGMVMDLNVNTLAPGVYIIRTEDETGVHFEKQLVIKR